MCSLQLPVWFFLEMDGMIRMTLTGCTICCTHSCTRIPRESLKSLRQVTKRLTLLLAGDLAKEVAAIFREVYTHPSKQLYDDTTVHLLCSNYWLQPIYQELLRASSRYNATVSGERKRPCSGFARVTTHLRPLKTKRQTDNTTQVLDWIGGKYYADTLQVWFPAHWMPHVVQQLQKKEDDYGLAHPSWFDQPEVPEKFQKSWREARERRETKFNFGTYENSIVEMISSALRADWFQPQVQAYLDMLPNLKAGVIVGVFKTKGATAWAAVRAEKLQVSMFLPNEQPMEEWFTTVHGLPSAWPDLSMIGSDNMRKVTARDLQDIRVR